MKKTLAILLMLSLASLLQAQANKQSSELTVYLSKHNRSFYNEAHKKLSTDGRRYQKNVVIKALAELPKSLSRSAGKVLIAGYASEWNKISTTLTKSTGADVTLWLVYPNKMPKMPKDFSGDFDAVSSASAGEPAYAAHRKLQAKLFQ